MPAALPRMLPLAAAMLLAAPASHAQWTVTPAVSISETWSDNSQLRDDDLAVSQFVTEVRPSLTITGRSRRLNLSAFAAWDQYSYSKRDEMFRPADNQRRYSGSLQGTLVEQLLYVDASASRSRRSVLAFGPSGEDNLYSNDNATDVTSWSVSPYLVRRFGRDTTMQLRYTRDALDGGMRNAFGPSDGNTYSFNLANGTSLRTIGWSLNYVRQDLENNLVGDSSSELANASLRYQYSRVWAATATAGYDKYDFEGPADISKGHSWSVGGVWTPSLRTSVQASVGRHLYGKTGSLVATVRSRRTVWELVYADSITSSRQQFMQSATNDTAAMLDRLFNTAIPDPVERQRAVAAYMLANGLPVGVAESVAYLSNRYARQKELRGSFAYRYARGTALLSAYRSERNALSNQQSDSPLLGTALTSLNDNIRQHGVNASVVFHLNGRSNLTSGANYRYSESLTTGIESQQRDLYVRMSRELGRNVNSSLEVRRRSGNTDFAGRRDYTENAVVANLNMSY